jgi:hypothetical protein
LTISVCYSCRREPPSYGTLFATDDLAILAALTVSTLLAAVIGGAIAASAQHAGNSVP